MSCRRRIRMLDKWQRREAEQQQQKKMYQVILMMRWQRTRQQQQRRRTSQRRVSVRELEQTQNFYHLYVNSKLSQSARLWRWQRNDREIFQDEAARVVVFVLFELKCVHGVWWKWRLCVSDAKIIIFIKWLNWASKERRKLLFTLSDAHLPPTHSSPPHNHINSLK